jgi:hypothetical protein
MKGAKGMKWLPAVAGFRLHVPEPGVSRYPVGALGVADPATAGSPGRD